jgi:hypothetical protein
MVAHIILPLERQFLRTHKYGESCDGNLFVVAQQLTVSRHVETYHCIGVIGVPTTVQKHQAVSGRKFAHTLNVDIVNRVFAPRSSCYFLL